ncbi:MAG: rod shape-determining protein MreD [Thermoanaerobaculia bacterium]|nr:rod shape-determining protein MreD [Thermoanaerobaculia bacterium]
MRGLKVAAGLLAALLLHVAGAEVWPYFPRAFDLFLVVLVLNSVDGDTLAGMLGGLAAGLLSDLLTGGPYGLFGFVDTILGYSSAFLAQRLVVRRLSTILVLLALAAAVQQALLISMALFLIPGSGLPALPWPFVKVGTAAVVGAVAYQVRRVALRGYGRWRSARSARLR